MTPDEAIYALYNKRPIVCTAEEYRAARQGLLYATIKYQLSGAESDVVYSIREMVRLDALHGHHDPHLLKMHETLA